MQTWSGRFSSNKTTHLFLAFLVLRNRTVCHFTRHESWRLSNRHNFLYVVKRYTRQFRVSLLELKEHRQTRTHFVSAKNRRQSCYGTSEAGFRPTSQKTCHNALNWGHSVVTTFITFPPVVRQQKARFSRQIYARVFSIPGGVKTNPRGSSSFTGGSEESHTQGLSFSRNPLGSDWASWSIKQRRFKIRYCCSVLSLDLNPARENPSS